MSNGRQFRAHQTETVEQHEPDDGESLLSQVVQATDQARYTMPEIEKIAKKAFASRMFGGGEEGGAPMTEEQAFMLMMISEATGDHPVMALLRWDIVKGKPAMKSAYVLARFQQAGGKVEWVTTTDTEVHAIFSCREHPKPFRVTLTLQELKDRKIAMAWDKQSNGWKLKYNYVNHARSMLRWRAVSEAVRAINPGILMGMMTDVEAEDLPGPGQSVSEATTRSKLIDHLEKRKEKPEDVVDAHGEVIGPPTAQEPASEAKPAATPGTEWGKWIASELDEWNIDREKMAEHHPELGGLAKKVTPMQVVNHLVKVSVGTDQSSLYTAGKRDPAKVVAFMTELWTTDQEWIEEETRSYLAEIIAKAAAKPVEQQAVLPVG